MGKKKRPLPKVAVLSPARDFNAKVQSKSLSSHHQISPLLKEDHWSRFEQMPHVNQARTPFCLDQRSTFAPSQSQKTTRQLPGLNNQKMTMLITYPDSLKVSKVFIPQKRHLPTIYHEHEAKGIPLSLPSLGQSGAPLLSPNHGDQSQNHGDSWTKGDQSQNHGDSWTKKSFETNKFPKVEQDQSYFNLYPTPTSTPVNENWFEAPFDPYPQDRILDEPLTCHGHQDEALPSHKLQVWDILNLNHSNKATTPPLPCLDYRDRVKSVTTSDLNPQVKASDLKSSYSQLYSKTTAVLSSQTNLYGKTTDPCSRCSYRPNSSPKKVSQLRDHQVSNTFPGKKRYCH
ncbi:uncharacterized protein LOC127553990 [Antechinus flavipes]|uniref:uncharacterized protein LOC127553990 n=1 Tax=Antechinus flavipes TaxID=38775 RepID=UPI0022369605|nr:uncharacterized protein LOC127553990 [Antechinus flavipes]